MQIHFSALALAQMANTSMSLPIRKAQQTIGEAASLYLRSVCVASDFNQIAGSKIDQRRVPVSRNVPPLL